MKIFYYFDPSLILLILLFVPFGIVNEYNKYKRKEIKQEIDTQQEIKFDFKPIVFKYLLPIIIYVFVTGYFSLFTGFYEIKYVPNNNKEILLKYAFKKNQLVIINKIDFYNEDLGKRIIINDSIRSVFMNGFLLSGAYAHSSAVFLDEKVIGNNPSKLHFTQY